MWNVRLNMYNYTVCGEDPQYHRIFSVFPIDWSMGKIYGADELWP
jgi:hypothetical protein